MADSLRAELVAVYATTPVAGIEQSEAYQNLVRRNQGNDRFYAERSKVEEAKLWVERFLKPPKTQVEEVQAALKLLIRERRGAQFGLYRELIEAGYKANWTAKQQAYFETARKKIAVQYDFFLSFTTRYESVPGYNTVNTAYKYFIEDLLSPEEINGADKRKTNLLAKAVLRLLTKAPSSPFFFPHFQYDNANTAQKLSEACKGCLVFVQLIRNVMFTVPTDERQNWCHYEWKTVYDVLETDDERSQRILFVVTENDQGLVQNLHVPLSYDDWHAYIRERDPPYLREMETYDPKRIADAKELLTEKVRPLLLKPLVRLVEGVP